MSFYHWYSSTLCFQRSKSEKRSLGKLMMSGRSIQYINIHLFWLWQYFYLIMLWGGVAGLGVWHSTWWMHSSCHLLGTDSADHTGASSSPVGKSSSSSSESISGGGVLSKVNHWWTPWQKGNSSLGEGRGRTLCSLVVCGVEAGLSC